MLKYTITARSSRLQCLPRPRGGGARNVYAGERGGVRPAAKPDQPVLPGALLPRVGTRNFWQHPRKAQLIIISFKIRIRHRQGLCSPVLIFYFKVEKLGWREKSTPSLVILLSLTRNESGEGRRGGDIEKKFKRNERETKKFICSQT